MVDASRAVACGQGDLFIAGGVESMSRAAFLMAKSEKAYGRRLAVFDSTLGPLFEGGVGQGLAAVLERIS